MELRMSVKNQLMSSASQPLTSLQLDPFKIHQQGQPPFHDNNNIIIAANNEILLKDPSSKPITKKFKKDKKNGKLGLLKNRSTIMHCRSIFTKNHSEG